LVQVDNRHPEAPFIAVTVENIVVTHGNIEKVPGTDAGRIVIIPPEFVTRHL
jgi:hypothetical protein